MKYAELERKLSKNGCYDTNEQANGHPLWYSPTTEKYFRLSNHKTQEVPRGNFNSIIKAAGIK
jgi:predicted RNA binding protein YcfA (HicA-like mRNA interferase family)